MGKPKADFVIETVRYRSNGEIDWVRGYERRGEAFSDVIILSRNELVERLKRGQKIFAGKRLPRMASTFELSKAVRLKEVNGRTMVVTEHTEASSDRLEGVPLI
ncbi:MAG: hypothetical protein RML93_09025 [Anaerolineales bacterium]|nr:hypothetical protein [Anaerolineales bacterium]MCS7248281.1 hypothetical protein [Anaerolineales bacterium]MDW8162095.1 hypothetical protein [Anaerolineales bacterium]MDW8447416.1 hypothetical protein [Anaerolineales bacterium]